MGSTDSSLEVAFLDVNNLNGCSSYLIIKPSAGESSARAIKIYAKENDMIISPWKRKGPGINAGTLPLPIISP